MRKRRSHRQSQAALADGYQSIPALAMPTTREAIATIVADERAERERERIEQDARAEHGARALATQTKPQGTGSCSFAVN